MTWKLETTIDKWQWLINDDVMNSENNLLLKSSIDQQFKYLDEMLKQNVLSWALDFLPQA